MNTLRKILVCSLIGLQSFPCLGSEGLWAKELESVLRQHGLRSGQYGIEVRNLSGDQTFFSANSSVGFNPASTLKILITIAALEKWGPAHTFSTTVKKYNQDICLVGNGDPSLVYEDLFRLTEYAYRSPSMGNSPLGDIIADDSFFPTTAAYAEDFSGDSQRSFTAPLSALSLNYNSVTIFIRPSRNGEKPFVYTEPRSRYFSIINQATTVAAAKRALYVETDEKSDHLQIKLGGQIGIGNAEQVVYRAIPNPGRYAGEIFRDLLERTGLKINGVVKQGICPSEATVLAEFDSKPLSQILQGMNKFSNNFIAEMLLVNFGDSFTSESGIKNLNQWIQTKPFPKQNVQVDNASGLSRTNLVTPNFLWSVLAYGRNRFDIFPEFLASFPLGSVDGTLRRRFRSETLQKKVRAKSGSLRDTVSLAGSVQTKEQGELLFAFLFTTSGKSVSEIQKIEEKLLERIVSLGEKK